MATIFYPFVARNSGSNPPGQPLTGLNPQWVFLKRFSDGSTITHPPVVEIGFGQYGVSYDPEASGEASGQIDLGTSVVNPSDRFVDLFFYLSDSRTVYNLDQAVSSPSTVGAVAAGAITSTSFAAGALPTPVDPNAVAKATSNMVWTASTRTLTTTVAGNPAAAAFIGTNTTAQGSWRGTVGADGYEIAQDTSGTTPSLPAYASVTLSGNSNYTWTTSTTDPRALQNAANNGRIAAVWYSYSSFTINLNLTDGQTHKVALYALDYDGYGPRSERIDIVDAASGTVLDSQTVSSFGQGEYLTWNLSGNLIIRVTNLNPSSNAVVSGLFFG